MKTLLMSVLLVCLGGCQATLLEGRMRLTLELPGVTLPEAQPFILLQGIIEDILGK